MTLVSIPGMTEDALLNTSTEPTGAGFLPFPCTASGWTKHTAHVIKAEIKIINNEENISIVVANVQHGGEVLIALDPSKVGPNCTNPEKQRQSNLENLMRAIKILGAHTKGKLDTDKLAKAHGQVVEIIAKHKGFRQWEGKHFHKVSLVLTGTAAEEVDVTPVGLPPLPGSNAPAAPIGSAPYGEELDPFLT